MSKLRNAVHTLFMPGWSIWNILTLGAALGISRAFFTWNMKWGDWISWKGLICTVLMFGVGVIAAIVDTKYNRWQVRDRDKLKAANEKFGNTMYDWGVKHGTDAAAVHTLLAAKLAAREVTSTLTPEAPKMAPKALPKTREVTEYLVELPEKLKKRIRKTREK